MKWVWCHNYVIIIMWLPSVNERKWVDMEFVSVYGMYNVMYNIILSPTCPLFGGSTVYNTFDQWSRQNGWIWFNNYPQTMIVCASDRGTIKVVGPSGIGSATCRVYYSNLRIYQRKCSILVVRSCCHYCCPLTLQSDRRSLHIHKSHRALCGRGILQRN